VGLPFFVAHAHAHAHAHARFISTTGKLLLSTSPEQGDTDRLSVVRESSYDLLQTSQNPLWQQTIFYPARDRHIKLG
jgi:hypothetical protein